MIQRKVALQIGISVFAVVCVALVMYAAQPDHPKINAVKKMKTNLRETKSTSGLHVGLNYASRETTKYKLLNYFKLISDVKTITGTYYYGPESNFAMKKGPLKSIAGVFPGILTIGMPKYSAEKNVWQTFINDTISRWKNGYLVHLNWGMDENPITLMDNLKEGNATDWKDLVTEDGRLNKVWKKELDVLAPYLKQFQTAGVVLVCDVLPYINWEDSKMWSGRPGVNGSLKIYQITLDYLTRHHDLYSIIWVWSVHVNQKIMMRLDDYWPGSNYVDVASFYFGSKKQLTTAEYEKVLEVVGDKPISMEHIWTAPTPQILAAQSRWTWFTVAIDGLSLSYLNRAENINATFNSPLVINRGNDEFFYTLNSNISMS